MSRTAIEVPDVLHRRRIPQRAIRAVVGQIAAQFGPQKVVLFGSYARGAPRPESDVDLLVIMETEDEAAQSLAVRQAIECNFGLEIIVRTPQNLERRLRLGDFFLREALAEGKTLYESADR